MDKTMVNLPGVKQGLAKEFYYNDDDIKMISVPIGKCQGDFNLYPEELKKYFGVDLKRMGPLPEYLITPHLNSTRNDSRSHSTGRSWWDITGEVVVYQPLEWVPIVHELATISASAFESEFKRKTTTIETWQVYGKNEISCTLYAGFSWKSMKLEISNTTKVEVNYSVSKEMQEEIVEKGKYGQVVIKKVVLGIGLKVKRVFERGIKLFVNGERNLDSLTWDGRERAPSSWNDIWVPSCALRDVSAFQFHPIKMSGSGHSDSLWLQVLPVFDVNHLTDMHLLLTCDSWIDWYAYLAGPKVVHSGRMETIALPGDKPPLVTFIPLEG